MKLVYRNDKKAEQFVTKISDGTENNKAYKLFVKAESLRKNKEFKLSICEYLKSIFLDRNNPQTLLGIALSYKNTQNFEKALKYFEKASAFSLNSFELYYNWGITQLIMNNPKDAVINLRKAILLNQDNLNAQIQLAIAHELMEEQNMACAIYQTIIDKNPSFLTAYNHKAALLMSMEKFNDAAVLFNNILKINPDFYRAYLGIALCFDKLGRPQDALRYYKKYVAIRPNAINAKRVMVRINDIKAEKSGCRQMPEYLSLV